MNDTAYLNVNFTPPATYVPSSPEVEEAGSAQLRLSPDVLAIWLEDDYEHAVAYLDTLADEASSLAAKIRLTQAAAEVQPQTAEAGDKGTTFVRQTWSPKAAEHTADGPSSAQVSP